ncbi:hypothetical protein [Kingella oralis]|uniref:hypothetical protein n=1 Tax=Kingella oralis TaxID=505 RepID=UPI002D808647|nr:hypothetical protein [Kingella oralis]
MWRVKSVFRLPLAGKCERQRQSEKQNRLVLSQTVFYWIDWFSGCLNGTATARRQMVYSTELYGLARCRRAANAPLAAGLHWFQAASYHQRQPEK